MFKYKEKKTAFTYNIQSVVHCRKFPFEPLEKMHDFQGYFSRTFQDQSDFPGLSRSWNFPEKIQDFPGGVGTLYNAPVKQGTNIYSKL